MAATGQPGRGSQRGCTGSGTVYTQGNGAIARVLQQADGRFSVVVDGERGLITTFKNLSETSLDRLAKNYGWTSS